MCFVVIASPFSSLHRFHLFTLLNRFHLYTVFTLHALRRSDDRMKPDEAGWNRMKPDEAGPNPEIHIKNYIEVIVWCHSFSSFHRFHPFTVFTFSPFWTVFTFTLFSPFTLYAGVTTGWNRTKPDETGWNRGWNRMKPDQIRRYTRTIILNL